MTRMRPLPPELEGKSGDSLTPELEALAQELYIERVKALLEFRATMPVDTITVAAMMDVAVNSAHEFGFNAQKTMEQLGIAVKKFFDDVANVQIVQLPGVEQGLFPNVNQKPTRMH